MYFNRETKRYEKGGPGLPENWEDMMLSEKVLAVSFVVFMALAASIA